MRIKTTKELKEAQSQIKALNKKVEDDIKTYKKLEPLEKREFMRQYEYPTQIVSTLPIKNARARLKESILINQQKIATLQLMCNQYQMVHRIHVIKDCYVVETTKTRDLYVSLEGMVKDKKIMSFPIRGPLFIDACDFIGKTLEEVESFKIIAETRSI